jgi:NAD(P)-dependent dehydrogenase (short-subunit alcohol dehydrogenase family)
MPGARQSPGGIGRVMRPVMLITGGSRGIGAATARLAAERGYDVAISFRSNEPAADAVVAACATVGAEAFAMRADVAVERDVVELFAAAVGELGRLDAVVNNAGTLHRAARLDEMSVERLEEVTRINVIGAFVVAREAVRRMSTRHGGNGGSIVNVSSAAAYLGSPSEYIDYAATKGALDTMTIGLAKEVATEGIRVNAVRPGLIYTDLHELSGIEDRVAKLAPNVPMQRGGQPEEVAEAILWLASPAASYVTGTLINISGGR